MFNPVSIPDIFNDVVSNASTALGLTLNYKFGSWKVINEELKNSQNDKFPLIALVQGWSESIENESTLAISDLKILIAVRAGETDRAQTRNDASYVAQIYPIYKALCEAIADSYYFTGYNVNFKHSVRDWPNVGLENGDRLLEDCIDGRLLENIELRVLLQSCFYPKPPCYYTPCPNGRVVSEITSINSTVITGLQTSTLSIAILDYDYTVAPPTLPSPFIPAIDKGTGVFPEDMNPDLTYSFDVSGFQSGFYVGIIRFGTIRLEFYYEVFAGIIIQHTSRIEIVITPTFDCQEYVDTNGHSLSIGLTYEMSRRDVDPSKLTGYELTPFAQATTTDTFTATDSVSKTTVIKTRYDEGNYMIYQDVLAGTHLTLRTAAYLKTKCS